MKNQLHCNWLLTLGTLTLLSLLAPSRVLAKPEPGQTVTSDRRIAQLFYPTAGSQQIAVAGQGRARVPADLARLDIVLSNRDPETPPMYEPAPNPGKPEPTPPAITQLSLAPIVEALKQAGVPAGKIQANSMSKSGSGRYYPPYYRGSSSISLEIEKPTQSRIQQLIEIVQNTAKKSDRPKIYVTDIYVQYAVSSCEAVETAAYQDALQDARLRATAIAKSLKVELADPPSVSEIPFFGRFYSTCSKDTDIVDALFRRTSNPYSPEIPAEVTIYREVGVTYKIR